MASQKVMIVDNDKESLDQLEELLSLTGYEMVAINDACGVPRVAIKEHPDVVILDIKIPGKNGFQLAEDLRRSSDLKDIPIIAMSGFYALEDLKKFTKERGFDMYLIKPFKPLDVISKIEELLLSRRGVN